MSQWDASEQTNKYRAIICIGLKKSLQEREPRRCTFWDASSITRANVCAEYVHVPIMKNVLSQRINCTD